MDTAVEALESKGLEALEGLEDERMSHLDVTDYLLDGTAADGVGNGGCGGGGSGGGGCHGGGDEDDDVFEVAALMMDATDEALHGCASGGDGSTSGESMDYHHGYAQKDIHLATTVKTRTKRRHSNGHSNKRKRSSFSRAAQISQRLQNEAMTGAISDEDIRWDPNDGLPHAGKWPIEEERYAYMLIRNFENGTLEDCVDGTTLRSYLAKTLRCAPMRVSKKFAGKCVGSKTYVRRVGEPGYSAPVRSDADIAAAAAAAAAAGGGDGGSPVKATARAVELASPSPPKYSLRKNAGRSYDGYDLEEDDEEDEEEDEEEEEEDEEELEAAVDGVGEDDAEDVSESTSREDDPTDPCSGSSSDGGMSDVSGSPRAKRHKLAAVGAGGAPAQQSPRASAAQSSPRGRRASPAATLSSSACRAAADDDFLAMVQVVVAQSSAHAAAAAADGGAAVAADDYEWHEAFSLFEKEADAGLATGDECGIGDGCDMKPSGSTMSLAMLE